MSFLVGKRYIQCVILLAAMIHNMEAVSRRAMINSALHLECRDNHTIQINSVTLGSDSPSCSHLLSSEDSDYVRVVDECSGHQSCSNIVLKESTRIPCTSIGLLDSEYMTVNYTCIPAFNVLSICHNTGRTVSPFEGYLSTPGYPSVVPQSMADGVVCNCQISSLSADVPLQLLLVDVLSSEQVEVTGPSIAPRYICDRTRSSRCINTVSTLYDSTVNITFQPDLLHPTKFILQYRAEGKLSRVRAVCSMTLMSPVIFNDTLLSPAVNSSDTPQVKTLKQEALRLEIIVGICAAALLLLICVIVAAIACRQCYDRRKERTSRRPLFRVLATDGNPTYDIVAANTHQYSNIGRGRKPSKAGSEHIYQEPAEYMAEDTQMFIPAERGDVEQATNFNDEYGNAVGSGIYESVEYLQDESDQRQSRLSDMKKAGSMPLHPAPPLPRNAALLRNQSKNSRRLNPATNRNRSDNNASKPPIVRNSTSEFLTEVLNDDAIASKLPSHTSELYLHRKSQTPSDVGSAEFNPKLDLDFSDLLLETEQRFVQQSAVYNNDPEYMEPAKVFSLEKTTGCQLVENELYRTGD